MLNSETIIVSPSCKKLTLENYVVGYKKEGESIVVLFKQDNDIFFSIVIDSYEKNENETIKILNENGVKCIDYLIWTHPHKDHSIGIKGILNSYCNKNSKVIFPNIDQTIIKDVPENCREDYDFFSKININGRNKNGEIIYGEFNTTIKKYNLLWKGDNINLEICCLTPNSKVLANNKFTTNTNINDFSVSIVIMFNGNVFVYGADMEDKSIVSLLNDKVILDNVAFIKAPHHGSHSTKKIFDLVNINENTVCAITNYQNGDIILPEQDILEEYNEQSNEIYLFNKNDELECGVLKSNFSMEDVNEIFYENMTYGLAYHFGE